METVECVVVGAGVVGLATAHALARSGREVLVLEAADAIGTGTSSRNSEVIHAGIYYPQDSLMARLCVLGRQQLYAYCAERGIAHQRCGKLIVATDDEEKLRLAAIAERASRNGVELEMLDASQAKALEPALATAGALLSPETGIISSHDLMFSLLADAEAYGAFVSLLSPLVSIALDDGGFVLETGGAEPMTLGCRVLVNAAGHDAPALARSLTAMPEHLIPRAYLAKGSYFALTGQAPFSRLIYPVPVKGGLGIHLTLDLAGQARFGPDVEWVESRDYDVDPERADRFYTGVRRYYPDLADGALLPAYAGIRPKIVPPDIANQDFLVQGPATHGIRGLVNFFGIESPGLTACLALADHAAASLAEPS